MSDASDDRSSRPDNGGSAQPTDDLGHANLEQAVETAASAYYAMCRKLARAVNYLKNRR